MTRRKIVDEFSHIESGHKRWKLRNPEQAKLSEKKRALNFKVNNPVGTILKRIRQRAKSRGLECTLTQEDIKIPEFCPVLGIPIEVGNSKGTHPNSASVDRVDNSKGYTPDNICIISWRANSIKRDASLEELEKIVKYIKEYVPFAG